MRLLKAIFATSLICCASASHALILNDVRHYNAPLTNGEYYGITFDLAEQGYNPATDAIVGLKLSFDLREIVETEEDIEHWEDMINWEFMIFYSWIFDGRSIFADVDTGIIEFSSSRRKTNECQYIDYVNDEETCLQNIDRDGKMSSWFVAFTDNLWLNSARLDAEIIRVPEPTPLLLLGLGLMGLGLRQSRHTKSHKLCF